MIERCGMGTKKTKKSGLGRSLSELLSDNDELSNIENKVLMHKDDGESVQIYAKSEGMSKKMAAFSDRRSTNGVAIGKTREERKEEKSGVYRHGKPHVIAEGNADPIKINPNSPKREEEAPRIEIGKGASTGASTEDGLRQLDRYSPPARDVFLEDLLEISENTPSKTYEKDRDGRIIIGSPNKSKVKRR